jgi:UPF0755 protein
MKKKELFFGGIILGAIILITVVFYTYQILYTANLNIQREKTQKAAYLYIQEGTTFAQLMLQLQKEKLLHEPVSFAFLAKMMNYQPHVKSGHYLIQPNSGNLAVIRILRAGTQSPVNLTFNNLRLLDDFTQKVSEALAFEKADLDKLLKSPETLKKYGFDSTNVMAMFLPNTYQVYWNISPQRFLDRMYQAYQNFWNETRLNKAKSIGFTPIQVSTLASIVQAETGKKDEKPRVAGAYINRLKKKMRLQADPTLVYAVGDFSIKRVLDVHKAVDSPYNTYKYAGLPPGPINMPTAESLDAVLNYETHAYIYFCAKEDFSGYHRFATNYTDHLKNAKLYQKALDMKGIK